MIYRVAAELKIGRTKNREFVSAEAVLSVMSLLRAAFRTAASASGKFAAARCILYEIIVIVIGSRLK